MLTPRLNRLTPYVPGEQPQDRKYLKLNTNENPYPPSPRVGAFLKELDPGDLRLYPDPASLRLREAIAARYGLKSANVFVSNGSDETLALAFFAFFDSGRGSLLFPEFTYSFYPVYCDFFGIESLKIPLRRDFSLDIERYLEPRPSCGIIFPNPNAPTGIYLPLDAVRTLLERYTRDRVVILDEAYIDFGGESGLGLMEEHPNLLVVRTFSKSMCLAGLRLGFALGSRELIEALFRAKDAFNSYPVDVLAQAIGALAVSDGAYYEAITAKIVATREYCSGALEEMGWQVLPSRANFIFAAREGVPGEKIYGTLKERGILVRHFKTRGIEDFVRITIGTRQDMERFLQEAGEAFPA